MAAVATIKQVTKRHSEQQNESDKQHATKEINNASVIIIVNRGASVTITELPVAARITVKCY